jgi:RNA ligase
LTKFFNYEEVNESDIPKEQFEITEKVDGSCLFVFEYKNELVFATRGSFESEQAKYAKIIWKGKYKDFEINYKSTWIFEVIYPENQIVVNYGQLRDLKLITIMDNESGQEYSFSLVKSLNRNVFPIVNSYNSIDFKNIRNEIPYDNSEGFVIRFYPSNYRLKLKYKEYCELHKVMTGVSEKTVWEWLKDGIDYKTIVSKLPDEMFNWVDSVIFRLNSLYVGTEFCCKMLMEDCLKDTTTQKDFALNVKKLVPTQEYWPIIFNMNRNHDYKELIWKLFKPNGQAMFRTSKIEN